MVTLLDVSAVAGHHAMPAALLFNIVFPPLLHSTSSSFFQSLCRVELSLLNHKTLRHGQTISVFVS